MYIWSRRTRPLARIVAHSDTGHSQEGAIHGGAGAGGGGEGGDMAPEEGAPAAARVQAREVHARSAPRADGRAPRNVRRAHPVPAGAGGGDTRTRRRRRRWQRRQQGRTRALLPRLRRRRHHPRRGLEADASLQNRSLLVLVIPLFLLMNKSKGRGAGESMRMGGGGAGARCAVDPEHQGRHAGPLWTAVRLRRVPLRPQVRRHAGGAARGGVDAVEPDAVAVPPQDHLRGHQDPLALGILHDGKRELRQPMLESNRIQRTTTRHGRATGRSKRSSTVAAASGRWRRGDQGAERRHPAQVAHGERARGGTGRAW
ncbi:hypothetical protein BS78_01G206600 [Paspalum vaginatum]|nr:hypothetical protein BS78_01G206600 [Paspalum vaginatum]